MAGTNGLAAHDISGLSREELAEHYEVLGLNFDYVSERLGELELAVDEIGWLRLSLESEMDFSRDGLARIIRMARIMYLKNPLIRRAIDLPAYYVFGQGINISAEYAPVNAVVQAFLDDRSNRAELTSHAARMGKERELRQTGNIFLTSFVNETTGRVQIRSIPVEEITDIICNPEDKREPWFYRRTWKQRELNPSSGRMRNEQKTALYPAWNYRPDSPLPDKIGRLDVKADTRVYHIKVGGLDNQQFGMPEVYPALDWARAATQYLEDYATVARALARFAWLMQTGATGRGAIDAAKRKLSTTYGVGTSGETNPPPGTGSVAFMGEGMSMQPANTRLAGPDPEGARRMWLMVASAIGLPETFFGDADVGNHATSKTLDRPTELMMMDRRTLWVDVYADMTDLAVDASIRAPENELVGEEITDAVGNLQLVLPVDEESTAKARADNSAATEVRYNRSVEISFPSLLEHEQTDRVAAIVNAATLAGHPSSGLLPARTIAGLLLEALGGDDIDEVLAKLYDGDGNLLDVPEPTAADPNHPDNQVPAIAEAVRELRNVLQEIKDKGAE